MNTTDETGAREESPPDNPLQTPESAGSRIQNRLYHTLQSVLQSEEDCMRLEVLDSLAQLNKELNRRD